MFNRLCINDLFALQRYKNFWTFLLFSLCFKALSTIYLQVGNFSLSGCARSTETSVIQCRGGVYPHPPSATVTYSLREAGSQ